MSQYSERLYQLRNEILSSMRDIIIQISQKTGQDRVFWADVTNNFLTDVCLETEDGVCSAVPEYLSIDRESDTVYIKFSERYSEEESYDGENMYTDTLSDILNDLTLYANKL